MNTLDSSLHNNQTLQSSPPDWFEVFLPLSATPLLVLLFFILPIFLLTAESLFAPVSEYVQSLLMPVNAGMSYTSLPLLLLIKIGIFCVFTFTGVTLLLLKISCLYHEVWSHFFHQAHPKHVPYHPDQQESMIALFNWNLFRWYKVLGPPLGWATLTVLAGALTMWLFNSFTDFGFFTFQLQFTLGFFIMSTLSLFTALAFAKGLVSGFTTILGDVAAITEPEKATQVIYERSKRLAFGSPWVGILYPIYFFFYVALIVEIILLIATYDIQDLLSFHPDTLIIFAFELVTFIIFILLSAMKFMTYHDALARYYQQNVK